jgi:hypothetical protein
LSLGMKFRRTRGFQTSAIFRSRRSYPTRIHSASSSQKTACRTIARSWSKRITGPETIKPTHPDRYTGNSLYAKFMAYLAFMKAEEFKKRYGVRNYYVLFVFTSRARMDNAKRCLAELTRENRFILFQQAHQEPETPKGYILTSACERVGHKPLLLNQTGGD